MQPRVNEEVDLRAAALAAVVEEIRGRVRARYPSGAVVGTVIGEVPLPDLAPLLRARDAAEGKVAAIGTVNPRAPGLVSSTVQFFKRMISRALDWHVREQVEFNRAAVSCIEVLLDTLADYNRTIMTLVAKTEGMAKSHRDLIDSKTDAMARAHGDSIDSMTAVIGGVVEDLRRVANDFGGVTQEFRDMRGHWNQWRQDWERHLAVNEIHFLRGVSELQAAFQHRVTLLEQEYREIARLQHDDFEGALNRAGEDIQKRLWDDLDRIRTEYEGIIHGEIRMLRQKAALVRLTTAQNAPAPVSNELSRLDWLKFAEKFRGAEEYVKERQQLYAERFAGIPGVLDLGCGRGEMLEVLRDAGIDAHGIDLSEESVALCREKGLRAERADVFEYLDAQADGSIGGMVCSQVVEHLPPERVPELVRLVHGKMRTHGLLAIETPNPECLAIFATHFYLDPTHTRPIPPPLLAFYMEEAGFGRLDIQRLYPAIETMPSLAALPEEFRKQFFGSLDYAVFGVKL